MNRGIARGTVFVDDESRVDFGRLLGENFERFGVEVVAYCLMDNHFHLVVSCPLAQLSASMQRLSSMYTRHLNDRFGRDGPLFRGRFTSRPITSTQYLANAVRYVHRNALDLPGVSSVESYRWSSHRAYHGYRRPPPWLRTDVVLDWFGGPDAFHRFASGARRQPLRIDRSQLGDVVTNLGFLLHSRSVDGRRVAAGDLRAAAFAVGDLVDGSDATAIADTLSLETDAARHNAQTRARKRLLQEPSLLEVALDGIDLTTSPDCQLGSDPS